jgi:hypothetical protein
MSNVSYRLPASQAAPPFAPGRIDTGAICTVAAGSAQEIALINAGAVPLSQLGSTPAFESQLSLIFNKACLIGDSITYRSYDNFSGSSFMQRANGWFTWTNALLRGRFSLVNQCAVNGYDTAHMLANFGTGVTGRGDGANDPLAVPVGWYFIMGGINDAQLGTSATVAASNLITMAKACLATGARVCMVTVPACSSGQLTSGQAEVVCEINAAIRQFARITPGVVLADGFAVTVNPLSTSAVALSGSADSSSVHPSAYGAYLIGNEVAKAVGAFLPPRTDRVSSQFDSIFTGGGNNKQLIANCMFETSAISGWAIGGSGPTNWTTGGTNVAGDTYLQAYTGFSAGTVTEVNPSVSGVGKAMQFTYTVGTVSNASPAQFGYNFGPINNPSNKANPGDVIYAECDIDITAYTGDISLCLRLVASTSQGADVESWWGNSAIPTAAVEYYGTGAAPASFTARTGDIVIPVGTLTLSAILYVMSDTTGATGTVQFSRHQMPKH